MIEKIRNFFLKNQHNLKEILYAQIFRDSIQDIAWLKNKNFSLSGGAANYSFIYFLFRILNEIKPKKILECGIGQTSKLSSQYAAYYPEISLKLIEHNTKWLSFFKEQISLSENIEFITPETKEVIYKNKKTNSYIELSNKIGNNLFDLIIIDGPEGSERYSRIYAVELTLSHLSKSFVIIIDDCDRKGEMETARECMRVLKRKSINFDYFFVYGIKKQCIIMSPDYQFLKTL